MDKKIVINLSKKEYLYNNLLGKSKEQILEELGDQFNFYPDDVWYYVLRKYWWGTKTVLFIVFDEEGKVSSRYIKNIHGKIKTT